MAPLTPTAIMRRVMVILFLVVAVVMPVAGNAAAPNPAPGVADVDGITSEWNLPVDFFADMYRAGDPTKEIQSKLYLRYDCDSETLYALVMPVAPYTIVASGPDAYLKVGSLKLVDGNSGDDGTPPDFQWVDVAGDVAQGWEASAYLVPGSYTDLNVHTNVYDENGQPQTSVVAGRAIELNITCAPTAVEVATISSTTAVPYGLYAMGAVLAAALVIGVRRIA